MNTLNNICKGIQNSIIAVFTTIAIIVVGVFYYNNSVNQSKLMSDQSIASKTENLALELQYNLSNSKGHNTLFFLDKKMNDVEAHKVILEEAMPQIDELASLHDEQAMQVLLAEIKEDFIAYAEQFYEVVDDHTVIGLTQSDGLQAEMTAVIDMVEKDVEENEAVVLDEIIAQMRRSEKDFLLTSGHTHIADMETLMTAFDMQLAKTTAISKYLKPNLEAEIDLYHAKFSAISVLIEEVHKDEIVLANMYAKVLLKLDKLVADSQEDLNDATTSMNANFDDTLVLILGVIIIIVVVVVSAPKSLNKATPVSNLGTAQLSTVFSSRTKLTQQELETLNVLKDGHTNKEIARILEIREVTVKKRLSRVFRKLGVSNRTQASLISLGESLDKQQLKH